MTLQATVRTALGTIKTLAPNSVVTVANASQSAEGVKDTVDAESSLAEYGEEGRTTGTVYLDASEFTRPERGDTITVDGDDVFVNDSDVDPVGAMLTIVYSKTRPVAGI